MTVDAAPSARRLEIYTRVSLYVMLAVLSIAYLGAFPSWGPTVGFVVGAVQSVANIAVCSRLLTMLHQGRRTPTRREALAGGCWLGLSVLVLVLVLAHVDLAGAWVPAVCAAAAAPLATAATLLSPRAVLTGSAVLAVMLGVAAGTRWSLSESIWFAGGALALLVFFGMTFWLTGWMLRNIWELEEARRTAGQLAIAEERLRISRDLHDLFGRTMATVAVKTELAGELVRRGQSDAALRQLGEVRGLAEQSGQQVRAVVRGYRVSDLGTELVGARSLLEAAGIRCAVSGRPPDDLPAPVADVLVWVLREATTNVIRHSSARECLITIEQPGPVRMIITNDGCGTNAPDQPGSGLVGMRERVASVAGEISCRVSDGRFTVEVTVPR